VILGKNYPHPILDHAEARLRALAALKTVTAAKEKPDQRRRR
jgi:deoxyribodipyrimidine photolyase